MNVIELCIEPKIGVKFSVADRYRELEIQPGQNNQTH